MSASSLRKQQQQQQQQQRDDDDNELRQQRPSLDILGDLYVQLASKPVYDKIFFALLVAFEAVVGLLIVNRVAYTEIDWVAYMQEVEGYLAGERDYLQIRGDTGPLVYPAGFLYLFATLRRIAGGDGTDVRAAQHVFYAMYLLTQLVVLALYQYPVASIRMEQQQQQQQQQQDAPQTSASTTTTMIVAHRIWYWRAAMSAVCLSKRIHSIFVLRLFNDAPTMLLLYASMYLFTRQRWDAGCVVFSLAVSVKMNVLLFAPGLLLLLLQASENLQQVVIVRLGLCCALPQLVLGAPFLLTYPVSYLRKAFELDRVFFYKWTVNWKFLDEDVFVSKRLSLLLLATHLSVLTICAVRWLQAAKRETGQRLFLTTGARKLSPDYIIYTIMFSNFIGICFARTLHYQFYVWYFHSVPYLLWSSSSTLASSTATTNRPAVSTYSLLLHLVCYVAIVGGMEMSFLTFPATPFSSAVLQACHIVILLLARLSPPSPICAKPLESVTKKKGD